MAPARVATLTQVLLFHVSLRIKDAALIEVQEIFKIDASAFEDLLVPSYCETRSRTEEYDDYLADKLHICVTEITFNRWCKRQDFEAWA